MFKGNFVTGTVEGTGAAINVPLGFKPKLVAAINIDDAGGLDPMVLWFDSLPDASMIKKLLIADNGTTGNNSHEYLTSNGISVYAGSAATEAAGFTIGADADLNVSAETIAYIAFAAE